MRKYGWNILLGLELTALSVTVYYAQLHIYHDSRNTFFYMLQDLAFLPVQILLVTLVLSEFLSSREARALREKMNMVIGAFFSEMGTDLMRTLAAFDPELAKLCPTMEIRATWKRADFAAAAESVKQYEVHLDSRLSSLPDLKERLITNRDLLLRLLENPSLLEHETFTHLLWSVSHLTEELAARLDVTTMCEPDRRHIEEDMKRAYKAVLHEWLLYANHLSDKYPYILSLLIRTNPFHKSARAEIQE